MPCALAPIGVAVLRNGVHHDCPIASSSLASHAPGCAPKVIPSVRCDPYAYTGVDAITRGDSRCGT